MDHRTNTPTTGDRSPWEEIQFTLQLMDADDALHALDELYSTYIMHCIEDGVPRDLHDSIFTLHKNIRDILRTWKIIAETKPKA